MSLTPAVRRSITAQIEMNSIGYAAGNVGIIDRTTGLVSPLKNFEPTTAIFEQLGHKWQSFEPPALVQRLQNIARTANFDLIASLHHSGADMPAPTEDTKQRTEN